MNVTAQDPDPVAAAQDLLKVQELPPEQHKILTDHIHSDGGVQDHVVTSAATALNLTETGSALHTLQAKVGTIHAIAEDNAERHGLSQNTDVQNDPVITAAVYNNAVTEEASSTQQVPEVTEIDPQKNLDVKDAVAGKDENWANAKDSKIRPHSRSRTHIQWRDSSSASTEGQSSEAGAEALSDIETEIEEGIEQEEQKEAVIGTSDASTDWKQPQYDHPVPHMDESADAAHISGSPTDLPEEVTDYAATDSASHQVQTEAPTQPTDSASVSQPSQVTHDIRSAQSTPSYPVLASPTPPSSAIDATLPPLDVDPLVNSGKAPPPAKKGWFHGWLTGSADK